MSKTEKYQNFVDHHKAMLTDYLEAPSFFTQQNESRNKLPLFSRIAASFPVTARHSNFLFNRLALSPRSCIISYTHTHTQTNNERIRTASAKKRRYFPGPLQLTRLYPRRFLRLLRARAPEDRTLNASDG